MLKRNTKEKAMFALNEYPHPINRKASGFQFIVTQEVINNFPA